jgi:hypothetical protein
VFEHSWRVGGATPAEIVAFEAFQRRPDVQVVRSSTVECYGRDVRLPRNAIVHFEGDDAYVGPITCYTLLDHEAHQAA